MVVDRAHIIVIHWLMTSTSDVRIVHTVSTDVVIRKRWDSAHKIDGLDILVFKCHLFREASEPSNA